MIKIPSNKQLSLTATLKKLEHSTNNNIISNSNIDHFGDIIDRKVYYGLLMKILFVIML